MQEPSNHDLRSCGFFDLQQRSGIVKGQFTLTIPEDSHLLSSSRTELPELLEKHGVPWEVYQSTYDAAAAILLDLRTSLQPLQEKQRLVKVTILASILCSLAVSAAISSLVSSGWNPFARSFFNFVIIFTFFKIVMDRANRVCHAPASEAIGKASTALKELARQQNVSYQEYGIELQVLISGKGSGGCLLVCFCGVKTEMILGLRFIQKQSDTVAQTSSPVVEELEKLYGLFLTGALTELEFKQKKASLLLPAVSEPACSSNMGSVPIAVEESQRRRSDEEPEKDQVLEIV